MLNLSEIEGHIFLGTVVYFDQWKGTICTRMRNLMPYPINQLVHQFNLFLNHGNFSTAMQEKVVMKKSFRRREIHSKLDGFLVSKETVVLRW